MMDKVRERNWDGGMWMKNVGVWWGWWGVSTGKKNEGGNCRQKMQRKMNRKRVRWKDTGRRIEE